MGEHEKTLSALYQKEQYCFAQLLSPQDRKEGVQAFLEKRQAHWKEN